MGYTESILTWLQMVPGCWCILGNTHTCGSFAKQFHCKYLSKYIWPSHEGCGEYIIRYVNPGSAFIKRDQPDPWIKDQIKKFSPINNFTPTVTKFCVMWEGQALPHDTKFGNCIDKIVDNRAFLSWSLIHVSSWSRLIKAEPGIAPPNSSANILNLLLECNEYMFIWLSVVHKWSCCLKQFWKIHLEIHIVYRYVTLMHVPKIQKYLFSLARLIQMENNLGIAL